MQRFKRLAVVIAGLAGLMATVAPQPAHATSAGSAAFIAAVTVGTPGIGYPILTLTIDTNVLPSGSPLQTLVHLVGGAQAPSSCLTLKPNDPTNDPFCLTNSHWTFDNMRTLSATSVLCEGSSVNVNKAPKPPANGGPCTFVTVTTPTLPNTVSGHCGLSSGQFTMVFTELGLLSLNTFFFDLHFKSFPLLIISGHWRKGSQHGLVFALADAIPPTPILNGPESCTTKTARNFIVVGQLVFVTSPAL